MKNLRSKDFILQTCNESLCHNQKKITDATGSNWFKKAGKSPIREYSEYWGVWRMSNVAYYMSKYKELAFKPFNV